MWQPNHIFLDKASTLILARDVQLKKEEKKQKSKVRFVEWDVVGGEKIKRLNTLLNHKHIFGNYFCETDNWASELLKRL